MDPTNDRYTNTRPELCMLRSCLVSKCMKSVTKKNAIDHELSNLESKKQKLIAQSNGLKEQIETYDMEIAAIDEKMERLG